MMFGKFIFWANDTECTSAVDPFVTTLSNTSKYIIITSVEVYHSLISMPLLKICFFVLA